MEHLDEAVELLDAAHGHLCHVPGFRTDPMGRRALWALCGILSYLDDVSVTELVLSHEEAVQ